MLDLIQWRARKTPEAPALFFNGRWYSYRELEARANRLANRLLSQGIRRGDRVAVMAQNHVVHFDLLLAAPKIGVVFAPLRPQATAEARAADAALIKPAMIFADSRHDDEAAAIGVPWARLSDYREWLLVGSPELPTPQALSVDDPHMMLSTPRGIAVLPYRQVLLSARHAADAWGLSARDGTVHCLPCAGPEINLLCLPLLYRGGKIVLMSRFDTDEYLGHLALHRVTVAALTPTMLRQVTDYGDFDEADLSSLQWLASVGGPAPLPVRNTLAERGLKLRTLYAVAEAGPNLFNAQPDDFELRPDLLGMPLPDVQALVRSGAGEETPSGEVGKLLFAGPTVFLGYLDAPLATAAVLDEGRYDSGLAVRQDADGQYLNLGRSEDAFVSDGSLVYPGEVETALLKIEVVIESAVIPVGDSAGGQSMLAAVVLQDGVQRDNASLASELGQHLPGVPLPRHYQRLKRLPRDAWGQVDRYALLAGFKP